MVDERFDELLHTLCADYPVHNNLNLEARTNSNIKRGLRNDDGTGVMVGCTAVGNVLGYTIEDGERVPMPGRLIYRGYDLSDLVDGPADASDDEFATSASSASAFRRSRTCCSSATCPIRSSTTCSSACCMILRICRRILQRT